jgi:biopolymer transport protein ExbD
MRLRAADRFHYNAGPNMTPLVDIVMVILIFMMLTGTFAVGEHFLQSNIAMSKKGLAASTPRSGLPLDTQLEIRVDGIMVTGEGGLSQPAWSVQTGGSRLDSRRSDDPNARAALIKLLNQRREELNRADTPTDKIQVVISPGKTTVYSHVVEVFSAAMEARFTKVAFAPAH